MKKSFRIADADHDEFVSALELENLLSLRPDEVKVMINDVDANGDGRISYDEWVRAMQDMTKKK